MIGEDIEVVITDIRGDKVRIGINAPKEITVHRKEVFEAIRRGEKKTVPYKEVAGNAPLNVDICSRCKGDGIGTDDYACSTCNGTGCVTESEHDAHEHGK